MTGGLAFEAINNAGHLGRQITVILNDNSLSISKSVGALSKYLTLITTNKTYNKLRNKIWKFSGMIPFFSRKVRHLIKKSENTIWGKKHNFKEIKTYKDFNKNVPVQGYEDIKFNIDLILSIFF